MGTWGPGNFENDAALDMVEEVLAVATTEIEAFCSSDRVGIEDLDDILAGVAVHLVLYKHCNASAPDLDLAASLRKKALRIFDEQIDSLDPQDDFKEQRRAAIAETLDSYEKAARDAA
jgi:hypothetical protein